MTCYVVDRKGRAKSKRLARNRVIAAAIVELLKAHNHLYKASFKGTGAKPTWDIATKNARRVLAALQKDEALPTLTICSEFLSSKTEKGR